MGRPRITIRSRKRLHLKTTNTRVLGGGESKSRKSLGGGICAGNDNTRGVEKKERYETDQLLRKTDHYKEGAEGENLKKISQKTPVPEAFKRMRCIQQELGVEKSYGGSRNVRRPTPRGSTRRTRGKEEL